MTRTVPQDVTLNFYQQSSDLMRRFLMNKILIQFRSLLSAIEKFL